MKELTSLESGESRVAAGEGMMPVREIFEALAATMHKSLADLEDMIYVDDPMPGVIGSFADMRGVLVGMGYANHA